MSRMANARRLRKNIKNIWVTPSLRRTLRQSPATKDGNPKNRVAALRGPEERVTRSRGGAEVRR